MSHTKKIYRGDFKLFIKCAGMSIAIISNSNNSTSIYKCIKAQ